MIPTWNWKGLLPMVTEIIPEFAVVGHPNEGKSAVVSTLAEDDSVHVSSYPGETIICQSFPVTIDGKEIIRFTDTPGFQNPNKMLNWMKNYNGPDDSLLHHFRKEYDGKPDFKEDVELFKPIAMGAGIIYVVDCSRPVRRVDLSEMEILRLTGRPRMAVINAKEDETGYLEDWKREFRKHFNAVREFNANKATYAERIELLETVKSIDQDWGPALEAVISAFKEDWQRRNAMTTEIICRMLEDSLAYSVTREVEKGADEEALKETLWREYNRNVKRMEKTAHQMIRRLFKHNAFNVDLSANSILREDLFDEKTWHFLGLTPGQLIAAAGMAGGAVGAALDIAAAGLTFGVFTAIGGLLGSGWAALGGGKRLAETKMVGLKLGGQQIRIGPIDNIQFMYVLLDRALIFYSQIINWAHGRRDYPVEEVSIIKQDKVGFTSEWDRKRKGVCHNFYTALRSGNLERKSASRKALKDLLQQELVKISHSEERYGLM